MGKKNRKISPEIKNMAIAEYEKTGNLSAVAKKYDITRPTFYAWLRELAMVKPPTPRVENACISAIYTTAQAAVRSIEQSTATRQEFLQQHYSQISELFGALVSKMTATVNDENSHPSLRDQAAALTALTNFVKEFTPVDEQGTTQINLLQQTVNK